MLALSGVRGRGLTEGSKWKRKCSRIRENHPVCPFLVAMFEYSIFCLDHSPDSWSNCSRHSPVKPSPVTNNHHLIHLLLLLDIRFSPAIGARSLMYVRSLVLVFSKVHVPVLGRQWLVEVICFLLVCVWVCFLALLCWACPVSVLTWQGGASLKLCSPVSYPLSAPWSCFGSVGEAV